VMFEDFSLLDSVDLIDLVGVIVGDVIVGDLGRLLNVVGELKNGCRSLIIKSWWSSLGDLMGGWFASSLGV